MKRFLYDRVEVERTFDEEHVDPDDISDSVEIQHDPQESVADEHVDEDTKESYVEDQQEDQLLQDDGVDNGDAFPENPQLGESSTPLMGGESGSALAAQSDAAGDIDVVVANKQPATMPSMSKEDEIKAQLKADLIRKKKLAESTDAGYDSPVHLHLNSVHCAVC
eukprot:SAG31_NODE_1499_length_8091_cov_2.089590_4_plen_165_part_00